MGRAERAADDDLPELSVPSAHRGDGGPRRIRRARAGASSLAARFLQDWLLLGTDDDWRLDTSRGSVSRTAADIGVHWLDLVETITGRHVEAVVAQLGYLHGRKTEDHAGLLIRFAGGMQGVCTLSQASAGRRNEVEVSLDGTAGSATWLSERSATSSGWASGTGRGGRERSWRFDAIGSRARESDAGGDEGRRNLFAAFYGTLDGKPSPVPLPTFADGLRHVRFAEATSLARVAVPGSTIAEMKTTPVELRS